MEKWDNEIMEILPNGERKIRFVPDWYYWKNCLVLGKDGMIDEHERLL